jgi:hypothetical protein
MRFVFLSSLLLLVACDSTGPTMRPGENCKSCHGFTAAGTVFPSAQAASSEGINGATVTIVDSNQKSVTMTSNSAGNFYTNDAIVWPATITLTLGSRSATMPDAHDGACASCHTTSGQGRIFLP